MRRQHPHLSVDEPTARQTGGRRGRPVVFSVDPAAAHADGGVFLQADNGVWLTDHVPVRYLRRLA